MKVSFFAPYPPGTAASQRFRFEQYFAELEKKGIQHNLYPFYSPGDFSILYKKNHLLKKAAGIIAGYSRRPLQLLKSLNSDYIMIHRELTPAGPPVFEWIMISVFHKKIIYDFDDALWLSDNPFGKAWLKHLKWHRKIAWLCRKSYRISAGNPYLAEFAARHNPSIRINPTTIDTSISKKFTVVHRHDQVTIGWTGSHTTLKYLELVREPLQKMLNKHDLTLIIICNHKPQWKLTGMEFIPWDKTKEWQDLSRIQIGLMPLPEDPWTLGKGGFKILEYFALGIPALASPVGINRQLIEHGKNGFLCKANNDWIKYLEILIQDPALRTRMGSSGKKLVEDSFSLRSNRANFLRLFE
jgi:glycosyltransferase involved in cell wall biosynthesis